MMIFKNLVDKVEFEEVWTSLLEHYPDCEDAYELYKKLFNELTDLKPLKNDSSMIIYIIDFTENDKTKYNISGRNNSSNWSEDLGLSTCMYEEWLGFNVDHNVIEMLSATLIVALCLYEMTWFGFDNVSIKTCLSEMSNKLDEL